MSARMIGLALRALPAEARSDVGPAIAAMAEDMIEQGSSSSLKEARGIAGYGMRKRLLRNWDWLLQLPWAGALWLLALPIASLTALLIAGTTSTFWIVLRPEGGLGYPGLWLIGVGVALAFAIAGACSRRRSLLALGAGALLSAFVYDTWGPSGSMLHGTSHTYDLVLGGAYVPASLLLIPTTILLLAASAARPPARRPHWATSLVWVALPVLAAAAWRSTLLISGTETLSVAVVLVVSLCFSLLALSGAARRRTDQLLAAALLLASQSITIAVVAVNFVASDRFGPVALLSMMVVAAPLVLITGFAMVRRNVPPAQGS